VLDISTRRGQLRWLMLGGFLCLMAGGFFVYKLISLSVAPVEQALTPTRTDEADLPLTLREGDQALAVGDVVDVLVPAGGPNEPRPLLRVLLENVTVLAVSGQAPQVTVRVSPEQAAQAKSVAQAGPCRFVVRRSAGRK
jgi:hypothetical protein